MSYERQYILNEFPDYDYRNPSRPHMVDYRVEAYRKIVGWQLMAFQMYWCIKQCKEEGRVGISFDVDLPFCNVVSQNKDNPDAHFFANPENFHIFANQEKFPIVVASSMISSLPCAKPEGIKKCNGFEAIGALRNWAKLLSPGGVLIAIFLDNRYAWQTGVDILKAMPQMTHAWSTEQMEKDILSQVSDIYDIEEIDTLKNFFSSNIVLRKK